ncbi:DUF3761 domain-containing protein [Mycobacterium intracellulare]|uniref:DUF3761 domain-containing protein n=1 Tax=Mycobacterium intracellulare TaxID=1767 RepID=UPI0009302D22|nr:hypothetical protein BWK49_15570 [Mycobacterium intracellulare subsp. chimaera]MCA2307937.1 DUF3761 domain-containing protein [Mycobacterium intracellulare subsp. chimaera]MCA2351892.1 DUF3761 domain-containing protein [Mycobacterium intracellulare subsp. chimaera]MCV7323694.1 DUF3761 domain-containing protein [Mycobacterium intracellulare subsp. chimaera]QGK49128.1 DUF3761 domain-containing protein [Mycobacterium intracellulare subsp. chimaera]
MCVRIVALIAATIAVLVTASTVLAPSASACPSGYYKAASGQCVHRPICAPAPPPGATAQCADGCYSFSENPDEDDTCHGRGGVQRAL